MRYERAGTLLWRVNHIIRPVNMAIFSGSTGLNTSLCTLLASTRNWFAVTKQAPEPGQVTRWWHSLAVRAGKGRIHCCSVGWHWLGLHWDQEGQVLVDSQKVLYCAAAV